MVYCEILWLAWYLYANSYSTAICVFLLPQIKNFKFVCRSSSWNILVLVVVNCTLFCTLVILYLFQHLFFLSLSCHMFLKHFTENTTRTSVLIVLRRGSYSPFHIWSYQITEIKYIELYLFVTSWKESVLHHLFLKYSRNSR